MSYADLGLILFVQMLATGLFVTLARAYKARIDMLLMVCTVGAAAFFLSMLFDHWVALVLQPLIAIAMVRNVHLFISQLQPPVVNSRKRDYGMMLIVALLLLCFVLVLLGGVLDVNLGGKALFDGVIVAHGFAVIADCLKKFRAINARIAGTVYGLGVAIPQMLRIGLEGAASSWDLDTLHLFSYFSVVSALIFFRMDDVLQHRSALLRAEGVLAGSQGAVPDMHLTVTLSRVLGTASHSLGTPSVIIGALRDVIMRKGVLAVEDRVVDSLTQALEKIGDSKRQLTEVHDLLALRREESVAINQMISDVIGLFEHSLSGVSVKIRGAENVAVSHVKSILFHILVAQITIHTLNLQRSTIHDRPRLEIDVSASGGWLKVQMCERGIVNRMTAGLDEEQLDLHTSIKGVLDAVGGSIHVGAFSSAPFQTEIVLEIR